MGRGRWHSSLEAMPVPALHVGEAPVPYDLRAWRLPGPLCAP